MSEPAGWRDQPHGERTWYAILVDGHYEYQSLDYEEALTQVHRAAAANPDRSYRLVSFPVPQGQDPEATAFRLGVMDSSWQPLWERTAPPPSRPRRALEPDATAPKPESNAPVYLTALVIVAVLGGLLAVIGVGRGVFDHKDPTPTPTSPQVSVSTTTGPSGSPSTVTVTTGPSETSSFPTSASQPSLPSSSNATHQRHDSPSRGTQQDPDPS